MTLRRARTVPRYGLPLVVGSFLLLTALGPLFLGWRYLVVAGGSMEPTIPYGSVVVVRVADGTDAKAGDIVAFRGERGEVVTHRIVGRDSSSGGFITRGDANRVNDARPLPADQVLANHVATIPFVGRVTALVRGAPILPSGLLVAGWAVARLAPRHPTSVLHHLRRHLRRKTLRLR